MATKAIGKLEESNSSLKQEKVDLQESIGQLMRKVDTGLAHKTELEGRLATQDRELLEKTTWLHEAITKVNKAVKTDEAIKENTAHG